MQDSNQSIAVIGAGVAGIVSAYILSRKYDVTLIEAADYVGGHTNTITIERGPDEGTPVDTGFIVLNDHNYPNFQEFLRQLNVPTRESNMSFSYYCRETKLGYNSYVPNGLFAQRQNLFNPKFLSMIRDIIRFNTGVLRDLNDGKLHNQTIGEYIGRKGYSKGFTDYYLVPSTAAIWSTPPDETLDFPAEALVNFFKNHHLLMLFNRPLWRTVIGGSQQYVKAFLAQFSGAVLTNAPVIGIKRDETGVDVHIKDAPSRRFDKVVIAAHADQALKMLDDPSTEEQRLLGAWRYHKNDTVLHTNASIMAPNRRVWASWNYIRDNSANGLNPVNVTYWMNSLQGLQTTHPYFVTLNDPNPIPDEHVIKNILYTHPHYTFDSLNTQADLPKLNGQQHTYFCGSYFGYGFHEDAVKSAVDVGRAFGLELADQPEKQEQVVPTMSPGIVPTGK